MSGSATFSLSADRLTRAEIARENRAETVTDLNVIGALDGIIEGANRWTD